MLREERVREIERQLRPLAASTGVMYWPEILEMLDHVDAQSATIKRLETERDDWSKLRSAINACRDDIKGAANATSYEMESAYFDSITRTLADALSLNSVETRS